MKHTLEPRRSIERSISILVHPTCDTVLITKYRACIYRYLESYYQRGLFSINLFVWVSINFSSSKPNKDF